MLVDANQGKVYGSNESILTYTFNPSLVNGDLMSGSLSRTVGEAVGVYPINIGTLSAGNNYSISFSNADFTVSRKTLTVDLSNVLANKVYNGNTLANMVGTASLVGLLPSDVNVVLSNPSSSAFADKNVGTNKPVSLSNFTISGTASENYALTQPTGFTANITKANLIVSIAATDKTYDASTSATTTATITSGLVAGDDVTVVSVSGAFDNKNVGTGKAVTANITAGGTDLGNYSFNSNASTTANITKANLVVGISASNKDYDGTTTANTTASIISGLVLGDVVTVQSSNGSFDTKAVGVGKAVSADISINGNDAGNYAFNAKANTTANISAIPLPVVISANPNVNFVKGGSPINFTATFGSNANLMGVPNIQLAGAGSTVNSAMTQKDALTWTYQWIPAITGDGVVNISVSAPDAEGDFIQSISGKTTIVLDNTSPTINLVEDNSLNIVKSGDVVSFTATFTDANEISVTNPPVITIGNEVSTLMFETSNKVWTYKWTVPANVNETVAVSVTAVDVANNSVTGGLNLTKFVIDNTPPSIPSLSLSITVHLNNLNFQQILEFSEQIKLLLANLNDAIILKKGSKNGPDVPFTATKTGFKGTLPTISIAGKLECATTYYLAIKAGSFSDVVGNVNQSMETTFTTDPNPDKPLLTAPSSAIDKSKNCPLDVVACSNFGASPLAYQWKLAGNDISGQMASTYVIPESTNGNISLYVKNTVTGCESISDNLPVNVYSVIHPVIQTKKEAGIESLLTVDNRANTFVKYQWSKADGSAIGSDVVSTRQFLSLPGTYSSGSYKVLATDKNGCAVMSDIKQVKFSRPSSVLYPTLNDGQFKVAFFYEELGLVTLKAINQWGQPLKMATYNKGESSAIIDVDMNGLPAGTYMLEVTMNAYRETLKFIVQ